MDGWLKIVTVIGLSALKFIAAMPFAKLAGLTYWQSVLYSILGGNLGVLLTMFLSKYLFPLYHHVVFYFKERFNRDQIPVKKKLFSKRKRLFTRFVSSYGLLGIAVLTPSITSIPVGTLLAMKMNESFTRSKLKVFLYLFVSIVCWSFIFNTIFYSF